MHNGHITMLIGLAFTAIGLHFHHDLIMGIGVVITAQGLWRVVKP